LALLKSVILGPFATTAAPHLLQYFKNGDVTISEAMRGIILSSTIRTPALILLAVSAAFHAITFSRNFESPTFLVIRFTGERKPLFS
jgi:hypothetical protein